MRRLVVTCPLPNKALSRNARVHWRTYAKAKAKYRLDCGIAARVAMNAQDFSGPPMERATVQPRFYFRERRVRDQDNLQGWIKHGLDALQDAGAVRNDNGLTFLECLVEIDRFNPRVVLEIFEQ